MRPAILPLAATILVLSGCGSSSHTVIQHGGSISISLQTVPAHVGVPKSRLIVPRVSMGNIRVGERRKAVAQALGPGKRIGRNYRSYLGGRLRIVYSYHDEYTGRAQALVTRWSGYRTRPGIHVGSSRHALDGLHLTCSDATCATPGNPDCTRILFWMRHGRVVQIYVGAS